MLTLDKPSQLVSALVETLRNVPALGAKVGRPEAFDGTTDLPWVLATIDRDAPGDRANNGRIAHVLTIALQILMPQPGQSASDLASTLKRWITDNRWGLPGDQCDLPADIEALAPALAGETASHWSLSFTQTLYLGPLLLDDPLGLPKFARTWEVSDIDDPDQYTALED